MSDVDAVIASWVEEQAATAPRMSDEVLRELAETFGLDREE
ncbi:hypothetical protein AB0I10_38275 [Streptomyces sp. NPDC050636]